MLQFKCRFLHFTFMPRKGVSLLVLFIILYLSSSILLVTSELPTSTKKDPNLFGNEDIPVLFIVVESTRSKNVGPCYGYDRETAPNLCKLAEDGVLFKNAYSQGSGTPISMPVLLTSQPPNAVGVPNFEKEISDNLTTLSDILNREGYESIIYRDTEFEFKFHQGLERKPLSYESSNNKLYRHVFIQANAHYPYHPEERFRRWDNVSLSSKEIRDLVIEDRQSIDDPIYTDYWHRPFLRNNSAQDMIDLYDADIRNADHYIGELVDKWKREGRYKDALIIVTSDHGEYFGENVRERMDENQENLEIWEWGHGGPPFDEVSKVPLAIKFPENRFAGKEIKEPVRHVDILPTIVDVLNLDSKTTLTGKSLLSVIKENEERFIYSSALPDEWWMSKNDTHKWFVHDPESYCENNGSAQRLCEYSKNESFECRTPREDFDPEMSSKLCNVWEQGEKMKKSNEKRKLNKTLRGRLENLGYLN